MSTNVVQVVAVQQPPVQTLQVATYVPVYLGTVEMDLRVKVSQLIIQISWSLSISYCYLEHWLYYTLAAWIAE